MTPTMRVREWTAAERHALRRGLKAADRFAVRRCQMRLASAGRVGPAAIGAAVGRSARAARNAIRAFHADGLGCLTRKPPVAKAPAPVWDRKHDDGLKGLPHRRPREFGQPTRLWALALAAEVCHPNGWTPRRLSPEGRRGVLARLGIGWKRAEHGITSPDPDDAKEKSSATGGSPRPPSAGRPVSPHTRPGSASWPGTTPTPPSPNSARGWALRSVPGRCVTTSGG